MIIYNGRVRLTIIMLLLIANTGCTFIKSLFPDKERDYQFRSEIPDLMIPDDLKPQQPNTVKTPSYPAPSTVLNKSPQPETINNAKPAVKAKPQPPEIASTKTVNSAPIEVEVSPATVSSIQIDQAKTQAWRLVGRALNRQKIEIVERNTDESYFFVKYDPNASKLKDESFWDEIDFLLGEDPSHEQQYRVSLLEISAQMTEVTVQNTEGKTISDTPATNLLKLITDGINLETHDDQQLDKKNQAPVSP